MAESGTDSEATKAEDLNGRKHDWRCGDCWLNFHIYGRGVSESRRLFALGLFRSVVAG